MHCHVCVLDWWCVWYDVVVLCVLCVYHMHYLCVYVCVWLCDGTQLCVIDGGCVLVCVCVVWSCVLVVCGLLIVCV